MVSGSNRLGQLGDGTNQDKLILESIYMNGDPNQPFIDPDDWDFGYSNGAVIDSKGKLWTSGANGNGQLGNGTINGTPQLEFKMVESIDIDSNYQATDVIVGDDYIVVQISNILYGCGYGPRFGMSGNITKFTRIPLPQDEKIKKIGNGYSHFGVLMQSGKLYLNGDNTSGQLGNGGIEGSWTTPVLPDVKDFSVSGSQSMVLMKNGTVMSSGSNDKGQLGLGVLGQTDGVDVNQTTFQTVYNTPSDIISIQNGVWHSGFLTANGELYFTGNDSEGQFGDGPTPSSRNTFERTHKNIKYFDTGRYITITVTDDNKILLFGHNY